jgi:hypothetical protein
MAALYIILLNIAYLYEILSNLNGIQGCTLTDLVAREPEGKTTVVAQVLTNTTYVDIILAGCLERHRISESRRIVLQRTSRSGGDSLLCLLNADRLLCLNPY